MSNLSNQKCIPCQGGMPPIAEEKREQLLLELNEWEIIDKHHLSKSYQLKNFKEALDLVNKISTTAEVENHHPDIEFGWGYVRVKIYTHKIENLTESDFVLAAKIDKIQLLTS